MKKNKIITILFLSGLYLTTLASILKPDDVFSPKEKRYLAQKPELSAKDVLSGKYGRDYESYLNDQFPMREQIASLHTGCERLLGKCEISGIYFGKSDYFIEHHEKSQYHTDLAKRNQEAVFQFLNNMSTQLGNDRVRFLAAPSAETVLTEYLPKGAPDSAENEVLKEYETQMGKAFVSLQKTLKQENTYYRTDHHWTTEGAFTAYQAWADSMGINPRQREEFEEVTLKDDFYGTVSARVNTEVKPDSLMALVPKFNVKYQVQYEGDSTIYDSLYARDLLDSPEPYAVYLKGNQPLTRIKTTGTPKEMAGRKLLVIKDSFGNSLIPFLVNHYEETIVVDLRYYNPSIKDLIERENITDICVVQNPAQMSKETSFYKINR